MKNNGKIKFTIIIFIMVAILGLCCIPPTNYNSKFKMNIVSSYGDNEAYHPKVLTFSKKWNGYQYWMSYTPYPGGDDRKENPHIAASNDLVNWEKVIIPDKALDEPEDKQPLKRYNSDSHIVYNNDLDRLECYWRYVDDIKNEAYLYRLISYDGRNWTNKQIAEYSSDRQKKKDFLSPAIIYENSMYKMWYVDKNKNIKYETSLDGLNWKNEGTISLKYNEKLQTWHLDIIASDLGYEMIVVAYDDWKNHNNMNLYYTKSKDGIVWEDAVKILEPTKKTSYWDNRGLYRSSFVKINGVYILYYGGTSKDLHHGIGLMYGKNIYKLNSTDTDFTKRKETDKLVEKIKKELK